MPNQLIVREPGTGTYQFADLVAGLPGARYIGHSWRDEPLHLYLMDTTDAPSIPAGIVHTFGYVYQPDVHWGDHELWNLTMLCIPTLAAEVLDQRLYLLGADDTEWAHIALGADNHPHLAAITALEAAAVTATMLTTSALIERGEVLLAADLADDYVAGCDLRGIPWRRSLELFPDDPWSDLEEIFNLLDALWR